METLRLHPGCAPGPVTCILASLSPTAGGCRAEFRLDGDLASVRIPSIAQSERTDQLWKTTCFEVFWQPTGGTAYREFNLSPSTRWAAYDFDAFRKNGRDATVEAIALACAHSHDHLLLAVDIVADLPAPADVALNAVIENTDGTVQYWALAFAEGKPEFHSSTCRKMKVGPRP